MLCGRPHTSMCMQVCLPTQELSPPCLASKMWDRNGPPAGPGKAPGSDYPYLIHCASGPPFPPVDVGLLLLAGFPSGGEHWIMGNVLIIMFAITYAC